MRLTAAVQQHWGWSIIMPFYCNHQEGVTTPPFDNVPSTKNVSEKLWQEGRETQEDAGDIKSIHHLKFFLSALQHTVEKLLKKTHFTKFYVPTQIRKLLWKNWVYDCLQKWTRWYRYNFAYLGIRWDIFEMIFNHTDLCTLLPKEH